jgi:Uncharacterized protein conserved in bacteria
MLAAMAILFHPKAGAFDGLKPPEMVKRRPVVVLSPKRDNANVCTVVPLSTTPPKQIRVHHHALPVGKYPFFDRIKPVWAKCDMTTCVSLARLDRMKLRGSYANTFLHYNDLQSIRLTLAEFLEITTKP